MKVAWWMYNTTDPSKFTMNSPKHCNAVFRSLLDRGHQLVLNHLVKPEPEGAVKVGHVIDNGPFAQYWGDQEFAFQTHQFLTQAVRHAVDPQNKAQRLLREWMDSSDWSPLEGVDVQYVELFPCVSLRAKLELAHAVLRGVLSGVHTVLVDQDFNASVVLSTIDDMYRLGETNGWSREEFRKYFHLWTPYVRRMYAGDQVVALPSYSVERELENPLEGDPLEVDYHFAYVGNDYQREEQLAKFYKRRHDNGTEVSNAIWGRWDYDKYPGLADAVGRDAFLGPVSPDQIHRCYRRAAASIGITHRNFYGPKLVAFRWLEVAEAGRMFFIDSRLQNGLGLFEESRFVEGPEHALTNLDLAMQGGYYWDSVAKDRERLRADPRLAPSWTVKALEHYGMAMHDGFPFQAPHQIDIEPKTI